jgi:CBS domain-containing protein
MSAIRDSEVQEWMTKAVITLLDSQTVGEALNIMQAEKIAAIPIVSDRGTCIGMVSASDLLRVTSATGEVLESQFPHFDDGLWAVNLIHQRLGSDKLRKVMTEMLTAVHPDTTMHDAACIMLNNHVHHVPVITATGDLVGVLSSSDFVRFVSNIRVKAD